MIGKTLGSPIEKSINKLYRQAEINAGALPGMYDNNWKPDKSFVCLTGNTQVAICFLRYEKIFPDLRLVNASIKLVDYVCNQQKKLKNYKLGSVAGSKPLWGKYMKFRYPNWAAKYHADSLILLMKRLKLNKIMSKVAIIAGYNKSWTSLYVAEELRLRNIKPSLIIISYPFTKNRLINVIRNRGLNAIKNYFLNKQTPSDKNVLVRKHLTNLNIHSPSLRKWAKLNNVKLFLLKILTLKKSVNEIKKFNLI